jgi:hypothetical protein
VIQAASASGCAAPISRRQARIDDLIAAIRVDKVATAGVGGRQ